MLATSVMQLTH